MAKVNLGEVVPTLPDFFNTFTELNTGTDLTTITTQGIYFASETTAKTLLNCPVKTDFILYVYKIDGKTLQSMIVKDNVFLRSL